MAEATDQQIAEFKRAFSLFDKNGDSKISREELSEVLEQLGNRMSQADVDKMLKEVDSDNSGTIEFDEFCTYMKNKMRRSSQPPSAEDIKRKTFQACDRDGNGLIGPQEFTEVMKHLGDDSITVEQAIEMIKKVDKDGNGKISYDEFLVLLQQ